jgi:hypothetical protein
MITDFVTWRMWPFAFWVIQCWNGLEFNVEPSSGSLRPILYFICETRSPVSPPSGAPVRMQEEGS